MGRSRRLTLRLKVDVAQKRHACQHNAAHVIRMGDRRLKVTRERTDEHYCIACGRRFIQESVALLAALDQQLTGIDVSVGDVVAEVRE
jgi:hypothetical protein